MLACVHADSPLTLKFALNTDAKNMQVYFAANSVWNGTAAGTPLRLARSELAPCGQRTAHHHKGVDEVVYVLNGTVEISTVIDGGNVITDIVSAGDSFVLPNGLPHSVVNPSCCERATVLQFFNAFDLKTVETIAAARNVFGSPYSSYQTPKFKDSVQAATTYFSYDANCLASCNLGPKYGQMPAP